MTKIFNSYAEFLKREDEKVNGVSEGFAKENPNWKEDNFNNIGCWNCIDCRYCRSCIDCSDCIDCRSCRSCRSCSDCSDCIDCIDCSDCSDCRSCIDCSDCIDCRYCRSCSYKQSETGDLEEKIPVIEKIHSKVSEAVQENGSLDMQEWHTCNTTHCRAGWVVHLAGKEGYKLEALTSSCFAAMMIYKKSSPEIRVSPNRFFDSNEEAKRHIKECYELEKMQLIEK